MSLAPGARLGPYEVVAALGAGGMGEVYKGRDTRLDRTVAIKVLPAEFSAESDRRARFEREARTIAGLNHPHICTLYDVGESEGSTFLVMEHLAGETLAQRLEKGPLPLERALTVATEIADALAAAHRQGVIHRDLKPGNVMLTDTGPTKLLDFGLAKAVGSGSAASGAGGADLPTVSVEKSLTSVGATMGTVSYMSPEQALGKELDGRTDLFSLGVVLYEAVTGTRPFRGDSVAALVDAILHETPTSPVRLNPDLPEDLERIISKLLEKDRELRYQSAGELLADLRRVGARADLSGAPTRRKARLRIRLAVAATVGAGAMLALAAAWNLGGLRERLSGVPNVPRIESLAVMPLENRSGDPGQEYFVDGMTEALIAELYRIPELKKVISPISVMLYKNTRKPTAQIARELNVDGLVQGSALREGDTVRVTVHLIHGATDQELWADKFDREYRNILSLYSDVARAIAEGIRLKLSPAGQVRRRVIDPEAYQLYLKGQYNWNKFTVDGLLKGIEYFGQAIDKDPSFALAYSGLANCYTVLGVNFRPPNETFPKAKAAALKALELDSTAGEPHVSMAALKILYDWDWTGAAYHLDRAMALSPGYAGLHNMRAYHSELMGRPDEAMTEILRAQELDPLAWVINLDVGIRHYFARQYDRAIEQCQGVLEIHPDSTLVSYFLWVIYEQRGDYGKALAELRRLTPADGRSETGSGRQGPLTRDGYLAALREELPKLQVLRDRRIVSAGDIAAVETLLGETDLAFEWLEKAYQNRDSRLPWVKLDPRFDALRADRRFEGLLRRMNLHP